MKDYSAMSDYLINQHVAESLTGRYLYFPDYVWDSEEEKRFDPCNNPADAWPIIAENKISLDFDGDGYEPQQNAWCKASTQCGHVYYGSEKEPLRNAMITFLMMKDAEKGHG